MVCPKCEKHFEQVKHWQRYCSERCRRNHTKILKRRERAALVIPPKPCAYVGCLRTFQPANGQQRFCSVGCRDRGVIAERRALAVAAGLGRKRRLCCSRCHGRHLHANCPRKEATTKLYGSTDADGRYVPPPGVKVRVITIPPTVHGDTVGALLKEASK